MSKINFSHFKKVSCDQDCAVLRHKDGHELKIARSVLSDKMKKDLDAIPMAEGGEAINKAPDKSKPGVSRMGEYVRESSGRADKSGERHMAKETAQRTLRDMDRFPKPNIKGLAQGGAVHKYAFGSDGIESQFEETAAANKDQQDLQDQSDQARADLNKPKPIGPAMDNMQNDSPFTRAQGSLASISPADQSPSQGVPSSLLPNEPDRSPAMQDVSSDAQEGPSGQVEQPQQVVSPPSIGKAIIGKQPAQQTQQVLDEDYLKAKNDYLNGAIKPETYHDLYAKKDTLGKIGMIFGLLLSGAGSGLTHQSDALLEMMNKEIDRDLEAQKAQKGNALNFLNLANQHSLAQSEIALRGIQGKEAQANTGLAQANTQLVNQNVAKTHALLGALGFTNQMVSKMPPGPQQQQGAQALQGVSNALDKHVSNMNAQTAQQTEANWQQQNQLMSFLDPAIGKYQQEHHIPGASGQSSLPIPEEQRKSMTELGNLGSAMKDAQGFLSQSGVVGPLSPAMRAQGAGLQNRLELEIGKLEGLGRFTPEEAKRYKQMIPDLTGTHFTQADQMRLNNLSKEVMEHKQNISSTYGAPMASEKDPDDGKIAINKKTGERKVRKGGEWVTVK